MGRVAGDPLLHDDGRYLRSWDPNSETTVHDIFIGGTLAGLSFAPGDDLLYVAQRDVVQTVFGEVWSEDEFEATIHVVDITGGGSITDIDFTVEGAEQGVFDIAIAKTGVGLFTTDFSGSGWNPFRQINTFGNSISPRTDFPGFPPGQIRQSSFLTLSEDGRYVLIQESNISDAPLHLYDCETDSFVASAAGDGFNNGKSAVNSAQGFVVNILYNSFKVYDLSLELVVDLGVYQDHGDIGGVAFSDDGSRLYALDTLSDAILEFDTSSWDLMAAYGLQTDLPSIVLFEGRGDIVISNDERLIIVQTDTGYEVIDLDFPSPPAGIATEYADRLLGGADNDVLDGLDGADTVIGFAGGDSLAGGQGADTLIGGAGADTLIGGTGIDTASYEDAGGGVTIRLWNGSGQGSDAAGDSLAEIENVAGSAFNDAIVGADNVANLLLGGGGDDGLFGLSGNDTVNGGTGGDNMDGGAGADTVDYSDAASGVIVRLWNPVGQAGGAAGDRLAGFEHVIGSAFNDAIVGVDNAANKLFGNGGNDGLYGLSGNDTIEGGAGADAIDGGSGTDYASYVNSNSGVKIRLWNGTGEGGHSQGDKLAGVEGVIGSVFNDAISGADGIDNILYGSLGNDTLFGKSGNDTFVFAKHYDHDVIGDFAGGGSASGDRIQLLGFGAAFNSFAEVMAAATQIGANTVINFGDGDVLTLTGVSKASLHANDFVFG